MKNTLTRLAAAAAVAIGGIGSAQAVVLSFDEAIDTSLAAFAPLLTHLDEVQTQGFWIDNYSTKAGAQPGDLVGALIDGSDLAATCAGLVCPTGNATHFLGALNDGYPDIGRLDGSQIRLIQLDASFIAAEGDVVLPTALLLRVEGWQGVNLAITEDIYLPGPVAGGYTFATYALSAAFANTLLSDVGFRGYACTTETTCTRALDKAQFALDNITISVVPEPGTWLLMGLGLAAVGTLARRQRAAA